MLNKATQEVSGVGRDVLKRLWDKYGDPGDVAFEAKVSIWSEQGHSLALKYTDSKPVWFVHVSRTFGP